MSDLGTARARILIDTSGVQSAQREVEAASRAMNQALSAVGISLGAAGVVQLARFAVEADKVATAYNRQRVAAETLAGSQRRLNEFLQVYDQATGGAIDKAQALADVTKLMSVGFADSAEELDQFARAIRGISIAMGTSQDTVTQNLILELFSQRGARLDQLGLQYDKVRQRADQLRAADANLTKEMAYQQAVLQQALQRFGRLTDSAEGQATGIERLRKAWKDFRLEVGQNPASPANIFAEQWAKDIERATRELEQFSEFMHEVERTGQRIRFNSGLSTFSPDFASGSGISDRVRGNTSRGVGAVVTPRFTDEQTAAIRDWANSVRDIERQANADRLAATQQYEEQRTSTIRQYEQTIAREAEDFARQRQRAEADFAKSISRQQRDMLQQEQRAAQELARTIAQREADYTETIGKARADATKRLTELEADYNRTRERAARDHQDRLLDAAGRLDAKAVAEAQRNFRRQQEDAKENFDEQRDKVNAQLAERLDQEAKALDKSISQQKEAYDRQLADSRAANAQRVADQLADFEERKTREDEDRGIRLDRLRQDHDDQLAELARQHTARMTQIDQQVEEQYQSLKEKYEQVFHDLNIQIDGYTGRLALATAEALKLFDALYRAAAVQQGPQPQNPFIAPPGQFPSLTTPAVAPSTVTNSSRSIMVNQQIIAAPGQSPYEVGAEVRRQFELLLREVAQ